MKKLDDRSWVLSCDDAVCREKIEAAYQQLKAAMES